MRLISCDALGRLLRVKEELDHPTTLRRIHQLLFPRELTKLDAIVDLLFFTAEDSKLGEVAPDSDDEDAAPEQPAGKKLVPVSFHSGIVARVEEALGAKLVKLTRSTFEDPTKRTLVLCLASREHDRRAHPYYWFALHRYQLEALKQRGDARIALGCGSPENVLLIPVAAIEPWLSGMNRTEREGRDYWHIQVSHEPPDKWTLMRRSGQPQIDLARYVQRGFTAPR
jgi:hypothetical protein